MKKASLLYARSELAEGEGFDPRKLSLQRFSSLFIEYTARIFKKKELSQPIIKIIVIQFFLSLRKRVVLTAR